MLVVATPLSLLLHRRSSLSLSLYRHLSRNHSTISPLHIRRNLTLSPSHLHHNNNKNTSSSYSCSCTSSSQPLHTQSNSILTDNDHYNNNNNYCNDNQQHHPWPEWSHFIRTLSSSFVAGEPQGEIVSDDLLVSNDYLPQEFLHHAASCLAFARNRPHLLGFHSSPYFV